MKRIINNFLIDAYNELVEEGGLALDYCEESNDFHITSYWITGIYTDARKFVSDNFSSDLFNCLVQMYPNELKALKSKANKLNGLISDFELAVEITATLILREYKKTPVWYTVYGSEEADAIDFKKYNVNNAINDTDEFPVLKLSDITAAMYGINDTVTPSDMYDVFGHYADELRFNDDDEILCDEDKYIFSPDPFLYDGVVARWKNYVDIKELDVKYSYQFDALSKIDNIQERDSSLISFAISDYLERFSSAPNSLPLHNKMIRVNSFNSCTSEYEVIFKIRGIQNKKDTWKFIYRGLYKAPKSAAELQLLIKTISTDFKSNLNGMEKVRNDSNSTTLYGKFPRKYLASTGLKFAKKHNAYTTNKRGIKEKVKPIRKYSLSLAEKQSTYFIKKALRYSNNTTISCSFGIDSIVTLHMLRRVTKNDYKIIFNNSLVEYPELLKYKKYISEKWKLNDKIIETKPVETYWSLKDKNGWNFNRKGDRRNGKSNSEECCNKIKHKPFYDLIAKNNFSMNLSGLRAYESRSRLQSMLRDGIVYYAKTWHMIRLNPIGFFTEDMIWQYVKKNNIEYCEVYDMKLYYEDVFEKVSEDEEGKVLYAPRVGCWCCLLNTSNYYLFFLKKYYKKQYDFLMHKKGLAKELYIKGAKKQGILPSDYTSEEPKKIVNSNIQISWFDSINPKSLDKKSDLLDRYTSLDLERIITQRPCKFMTD